VLDCAFVFFLGFFYHTVLQMASVNLLVVYSVVSHLSLVHSERVRFTPSWKLWAICHNNCWISSKLFFSRLKLRESIQKPGDIGVLEYFAIAVSHFICECFFIVSVRFESLSLVLIRSVSTITNSSSFVGSFGSGLQILKVVLHFKVSFGVTYSVKISFIIHLTN